MSRVAVSTRKAFTVEIGGKSRRFWTEAAAYYAIAKSLVGRRYLAAMKAADRCDEYCNPMGDLAEELGIPAEVATARAVRGHALFSSIEDVHAEGQGSIAHTYFDSAKWTAYVRRVAKKLRAMDARRGAA